MIIIKNKRCSIAKINKEYPDAIIIDVTSKASDEFLKLSPFYPHGGIPIPGDRGCSESVEGIWQGLKIFENAPYTDHHCFLNIHLHIHIIMYSFHNIFHQLML